MGAENRTVTHALCRSLSMAGVRDHLTVATTTVQADKSRKSASVFPKNVGLIQDILFIAEVLRNQRN